MSFTSGISLPIPPLQRSASQASHSNLRRYFGLASTHYPPKPRKPKSCVKFFYSGLSSKTIMLSLQVKTLHNALYKKARYLHTSVVVRVQNELLV